MVLVSAGPLGPALGTLSCLSRNSSERVCVFARTYNKTIHVKFAIYVLNVVAGIHLSECEAQSQGSQLIVKTDICVSLSGV